MRAAYYRAVTPNGTREHAIAAPDGIERNHYREGTTLCGIQARSKSAAFGPKVPRACTRCVAEWHRREKRD